MVSRYRLLAVLLSVFVVLGLVVAFVPFHALESETAVDSGVGTARANDATAPSDGPLRLVVLGDGPFAEQFESSLAEQLEPRWGTVERVDEPTPGETPILVVGMAETDIRYNPVSPTAEATVEFAFVGSGNGTVAAQFARGETPMVITNETPYVVQGDVTIRDRSSGVASLPGYRNLVADRLAESLAEALGNAPGM